MIENAKPSDLNEIVAIETRSNMTPWSQEMLSENINDNSDCGFFLSKNVNKQILAYLISLQVLDEVNLLHIVVDFNIRSQGIARQLMDYWLANLKPEIKTAWLEVRESNQIAQSLYRSYGFVKVDERKRYYRIPDSTEKETALIYCLKLTH